VNFGGKLVNSMVPESPNKKMKKRKKSTFFDNFAKLFESIFKIYIK
jgi:hypothetical protein